MAETARRTDGPKGYKDAMATLDDLQGLRREIHDELGGIRQDIATFQREIQSYLSRKTETNWTTVLTAVSVALILAGMGGALINAVINAESSLREQSNSHLEETDGRTEDTLNLVMQRELEDSYHRGKTEQQFATLEEAIESAVENRKDIDAKHVAAQERLSQQIEEVRHSLDNGLGRRIEEMINPIVERLIALERDVFDDRKNNRDIDRN